MVGAHRVPEPPYTAGPQAAAAGATAMIDISDGLLADAWHLAKASRVGIDVDSAAVAVASQLVEVASALGADARHWVLTGGEDHALLASFPAGVALPAGWTEVGVVREGRGVTVDGSVVLPGGWQHFS